MGDEVYVAVMSLDQRWQRSVVVDGVVDGRCVGGALFDEEARRVSCRQAR